MPALPVHEPMWRLTPGQRLAHRGWDGQFVIYNSLSGDTHLIDTDAMDILLLLQRGGATQPALLAALSDDAAGQDDAACVAALLAELQSYWLVEQV